VVLCIDSMTDMQAAAALIRSHLAHGKQQPQQPQQPQQQASHSVLLRELAGVSEGGEVGVGIMCNWTCHDARIVLEQQVGSRAGGTVLARGQRSAGGCACGCCPGAACGQGRVCGCAAAIVVELLAVVVELQWVEG